jgi:GTP-binding protein HflX
MSEQEKKQIKNIRGQHKTITEDREGTRARIVEDEKALLVGLQKREQHAGEEEETMRELQTLCRTAGVNVIRTVVQRRSRASAATFVHKGKAEEIKVMVDASGVEVVIFNDELTPMQGRNLEEQLQVKIVDRAQLIMDIFAQRAATSDAMLQVELAQLQYLLPRLRGWGDALSRQGGGIGTRGPGETKLTMERRQLRDRIHRLKKQLEQAKTKREVNRQQRQKQGIAEVVLMGYTNTGKSTILNLLSEAEAEAEDKLFATLNPLVRRVALPDHSEMVLADTVGFIRKLPKQLVPAFQSTLESVKHADLLLHITDASDPSLIHKWDSVREILGDVLDEDDWPPVLHVLNKMDAITDLSQDAVLEAKSQFTHWVEVSALEEQGIDTLLETVVKLLDRGKVSVEFHIPYAQGQWVERLHRAGEVEQQEYEGEYMAVSVVLPRVEFDKMISQAEGDGLTWSMSNGHSVENGAVE